MAVLAGYAATGGGFNSYLGALRSRGLIEGYGDRLGITEKAGYEANGGGFNNALGRLRTLELVQGRGKLRANDTLFDTTA